MLCRFGRSELSRPVRATVWLNVAWIRPSAAISCSNPSPYVPRSFSTSRWRSSGSMNSGHWSRSFSSVAASVEYPVLVFFPPGQAALGEQQLAKLDRRVEVQIVAADHPPQLGAEPLDLLDQADVDRAQHVAVDRDADVLHAGEHPHERVLDVAVEPGHALRLERGVDRLGDMVNRERLLPRKLRHLDRVAVEIELARSSAAAARWREHR